MLNGLAPIFIFDFQSLIPSAAEILSGRPQVTPSSGGRISLPPIPLYLDERLTGLVVESESKNISLDTELNVTTTDGSPSNYQKVLGSIVTINLKASKNSIGLSILMAMSDLILGKVAAKEYSVTYMNKAFLAIGALLHDFSVDGNDESDLYRIKIELAAPGKKTKVAEVGNSQRETLGTPQTLSPRNKALQLEHFG
jgi:hypothetical protein